MVSRVVKDFSNLFLGIILFYPVVVKSWIQDWTDGPVIKSAGCGLEQLLHTFSSSSWEAMVGTSCTHDQLLCIEKSKLAKVSS